MLLQQNIHVNTTTSATYASRYLLPINKSYRHYRCQHQYYQNYHCHFCFRYRYHFIFFQEKGADVIIVLVHWGQEYFPRMNNLQRRVAQHLTSLGVQLIIGCHPHVEQPYSYHGNRFVAYSLGNLVFLHELTPANCKVRRNS